MPRHSKSDHRDREDQAPSASTYSFVHEVIMISATGLVLVVVGWLVMRMLGVSGSLYNIWDRVGATMILVGFGCAIVSIVIFIVTKTSLP
jgi:hypothetical protein